MTPTAPYPILDAHAHLTDLLLLKDLPHVLRQAAEQGVVAILTNATGPQDWDQVMDVSRHPLCFAALGLHPFRMDQWRADLIPQLRQRLTAPSPDAKVVAIGEIGLDAWNGRDTMPDQLTALAAQLQLAQELSLPVCLHVRKAWNDFFHLLDHLHIHRLAGLCHDFTGSPDILRQVLKLGLNVSFCGPATNPNARKIRQAILAAPADAILTETDCPNRPIPQTQSPVSLPAHAGLVLKTIAELKGLPEAQLARQVLRNFQQLFLPDRP